jgi:hypothetical protein
LVGVPTNVTVTAENGKAFIGWDPVNGTDWYRIEWETDPRNLAVGAGAVDVTHGGAPAPPLPGNSLYVYTVTRADHATVVVSAMPVQNDPTIPSGVSLTPGPRDNRLSWNAVTGATAYRVYWSFWSFSTGVTSSNATRIDAITDTTYLHEGLEPGTEYHYVVTAVFSQDEEGPASAEVGGRPGETATVTITAGDRSVRLAWTEAVESIAYLTSHAELVEPSRKLPYEVSPLDNDRRHGFRVIPHFPAGEGRPSTHVYATPAAPITGVPSGVTLTAGPGYNTITWLPVTGVTSYTIAWRSLDTGEPSSGEFASLSGTTYRHPGLDTCIATDIQRSRRGLDPTPSLSTPYHESAGRAVDGPQTGSKPCHARRRRDCRPDHGDLV